VSFPANDDARERVRQAVDIVDLVGSYLPLRRQGANYVALCPWHDDSRPSLNVNPVRQSWKCWVCNLGGDIFSFVMQHEKVEFREALELLADRAGIVLQAPPPGSKQAPASEKQQLFAALAWAEDQFHQCLLQADEAYVARKYLDDRGITDESIARYRIGYCPESRIWLRDRSRTTSFDTELLTRVGLVGNAAATGRPYELFTGRVIFPIHDVQNRPIAFGGRVLPGSTDSRKYVNSPETRLFSKSNQVYGLNVVKDAVTKAKNVLVMEGYTDVVVAKQCGIDNVVAVLGTALGPGHLKLLRRFADTVTLVLDGDEAGQRRTNEVLELFLANQVDLKIVTLPEGLDPCDFLLDHGAEAFRGILGQAADALEHKIRVATANIDLRKDLHRAHQALEQILQSMAKMTIQATDSALRLREQQVLSRLSRDFRIDDVELRDRLRDLRQQQKQRPAFSHAAAHAEPTRPAAIRHTPLDPWDREVLEFLTQHPEMMQPLTESISIQDLRSETAKAIFGVYLELFMLGELPEFGRVLTTMDDPHSKSVLVELDESGRAKAKQASEQWLREVLLAFERRAADEACSDTLAELEKEALSEDEQLDLLTQLVNRKRVRQGFSAPKEG
jgi:DNA primase